MKLTIESIFTTQGTEALCSGIAGQNDRGRIIGRLALFALGGAVLYGFTMGLLAVWRHMEVVRAFVCPDENDERTTWLLRIWFLLYMFIGAQMSYLLSPFVGTDANYVLITSHKGDFFSYLLGLLRDWMAN